jgi:hypothetical protein
LRCPWIAADYFGYWAPVPVSRTRSRRPAAGATARRGHCGALAPARRRRRSLPNARMRALASERRFARVAGGACATHDPNSARSVAAAEPDRSRATAFARAREVHGADNASGIRGMLPGGSGKSSAGRRAGGSISGWEISSARSAGRRSEAQGTVASRRCSACLGRARQALLRQWQSAGMARARPSPDGALSAMSESETTATPPASPADAPVPAETAQRSVDPSEDEVASGPDTPAEGDERG